MANGKEAHTFTKKNKMQDKKLTNELNQLSSELQGKLNAITKEAETLKKHSLAYDDPHFLTGNSHTHRKGSIDELTMRMAMFKKIVTDVTGTKSIGPRKQSGRFKESSASTVKPCIIIQAPPEMDWVPKDNEYKTKPNSANPKTSRKMLSVDQLFASRYKRRSSIDVASISHQAHAQRRGSHGTLQEYVIDDKMGHISSESSLTGSTDVLDPDLERVFSRTTRGRHMSLPAVLAPMNIRSYVQDNGKSRPGSSALTSHGVPVLNHIQTPATLYLRRLKSELDQRKPKTLAQLRTNPKTTVQEEIEQDFIEAEHQRRAVEIAGLRIQESNLAQCRYLRRGSQDRELSIDEIFEKS